jgi:peroxiredoxin
MKKGIILALALCLSIGVFAQKFSLEGQLKNYPETEIYIFGTLGKKALFVDTLEVKNGEFSFQHSLEHPCCVKLVSKDRRNRQEFFVDNSSHTIIGELSQPEISGGKAYKEYVSFNKVKTQEKKRFDEINKQLKNVEEGSKEAEVLMEKFMTEFKKSYENTLEYAKKNPSSYIAYHHFTKLDYFVPVAKMLDCYEGFATEIKNLKDAQLYHEKLLKLQKTSAGAKAIDFTLNDVDGKPVSLSDYRGKYVLLDFWASWCGPCRKENPHVVKMFNKFKEKGFDVLSVSIDTNKKAWLKAIEKDALTWTHVSDLKGWKCELIETYSVSGVPTTILIGPDGIIIGRNIKGKYLERKLEEILK